MENTDLHVHSNYSDGILSPKEVIKRAKEKGVKNLALTDHNSISGIKEAIEEGKKTGVRVIPGIEIKFSGGEMLGYFIDIESKELKEFLEKTNKIYSSRIKACCEELKIKGFNITFEGLQKEFPNAKNNLNWTHICYFFYKRKLKNSISETYELLKNNSSWRKVKEASINDAIKIIINAKGIPILAHPWITKQSKSLLNEPRINESMKEGLKGMEIDQGDRNERRDEKFVKKIENVAKKYNLILTSGSDFHGDFLIDSNEDKNHHELGAHNCEEEILEKLSKIPKMTQKKLF